MLRREEHFAWLRLLWRLGRRSPQALTEPPERPVGAKLEITYACNLRCGFCYTDSPRRTLQRTPELSDSQWREVIRQSLESGIVEAVITGGEPLLRRELTLGIIETLAGEGVGVTLNTNGWFLDDEAARRLGALRGVTAHVSIDGARPWLHDTSRGVPGSWRRAVEGIDRLLAAGVGVCAVHVVSPENADSVTDFLEQMWVLGVPWVRVTPVVETGAAARGGDWKVSRPALRRTVEAFRSRRGDAMKVTLQPGTGGVIGLQGKAAPGSYLVRPNGDVRPDSARPFTFGNAVRDGVAGCWSAIREGWDDRRIGQWAKSIHGPRDLAESDLVAYLDDEVPIVPGVTGAAGGSGREAPVPEKTAPDPVEPTQDMQAARREVRELALARRYRHAPLRSAGSSAGRFVRLVSDGRYLRLNESGAVVMDALDDGTLGDAATALCERYGIDEARAREDAIGATRDLLARGVLAAGSGARAFAAEAGTTDLPGLEPNRVEAPA